MSGESGAEGCRLGSLDREGALGHSAHLCHALAVALQGRNPAPQLEGLRVARHHGQELPGLEG